MASSKGSEPTEPIVEPAAELESGADAPSPEDEGTPSLEPAAAPAGADLLSVFQNSQVETEDLSLIVGLAGEVEIADLLEELQTVVAALKRKRAESAA